MICCCSLSVSESVSCGDTGIKLDSVRATLGGRVPGSPGDPSSNNNLLSCSNTFCADDAVDGTSGTRGNVGPDGRFCRKLLPRSNGCCQELLGNDVALDDDSGLPFIGISIHLDVLRLDATREIVGLCTNSLFPNKLFAVPMSLKDVSIPLIFGDAGPATGGCARGD